ncbi:hypothetical protein [Nonomuraea dietziae]|uniref:hypothetical protein n=1 Tax=Nonomuraea dietziae TaxID=65515 RepID=UPI0033EBCFE9
MAPAITQLVVSTVAAAVGLVEHPLVEETRRVLERDEVSPAEREALRARLHRAAEETTQTMRRQHKSMPDTAEVEWLEQVSHALYALSNALSPSPEHAAYAVAGEAFRVPRLSRTDGKRLLVLRNVADRILSEDFHHS